MTVDELKSAALSLPMQPGVYIMFDRQGRVIYVGKAKKLKNRVSQYFQETASHSLKTKLMVGNVDHFEVIVADSEFEALILECSLIKQHMPKYNILLKDDKGFPYLRMNMDDPYPAISMVNKPSDDDASYYGPYGSRGVTNSVLQTILLSLKLPDCAKKFPRDIGKGRPCLRYHMNQCKGWCQGLRNQQEYRETIERARLLLQGNYKSVSDDIKCEMLSAADELNFELAASLRDQLNAIEALGKKQLVTAGSVSDLDVIGYAEAEDRACFVVMHFRDGSLLDKDYELIHTPDDKEQAVSSLMKQYYLKRGFAPKTVLLPFPILDALLFARLYEENHNQKIRFIVPQRGEKAKMVALAVKNAYEEAARATARDEKSSTAIKLLGKMLAISTPARIEAYDISNISGTDIVAAMVVFIGGKPHRSEYKRFKIQDLTNQDDYASMFQVIRRRFVRYLSGDNGFDAQPDLLLIDGGVAHAQTAVSALLELCLDFPVFGMVKDDAHRTRALVAPDGKEIRIDNQQSVFALIGAIQEETHRFAITYHRKLRSRRLKYSELDKIPGIGPKRKQELLRIFKSLTGIAQAELYELEQYLPRNAANAVYHYFRNKEEKGDAECE